MRNIKIFKSKLALSLWQNRNHISFCYINDIPQALPAVHTQLYADDTSMFYQDKGIMEIENVLNNESANV